MKKSTKLLLHAIVALILAIVCVSNADITSDNPDTFLVVAGSLMTVFSWFFTVVGLRAFVDEELNK